MKKNALNKLVVARQTIKSLDTAALHHVDGGRIRQTRVSECDGDCPTRPPESGHCITD